MSNYCKKYFVLGLVALNLNACDGRKNRQNPDHGEQVDHSTEVDKIDQVAEKRTLGDVIPPATQSGTTATLDDSPTIIVSKPVPAVVDKSESKVETLETTVPKTELTVIPVSDQSKEKLAQEMAEAELLLSFHKEFDPMLDTWEKSLRKAIVLLDGGYLQTVTSHHLLALTNKRNELVEFVNGHKIDNESKKSSLNTIDSYFKKFEDNFNVRRSLGSPAREFANLANREIKRLKDICTSEHTGELSCDIILNLDSQDFSYLAISKWSQKLLLPFETTILNLGQAPLNEEQAKVAEELCQKISSTVAVN